jgi:hypothetical protein
MVRQRSLKSIYASEWPSVLHFFLNCYVLW